MTAQEAGAFGGRLIGLAELFDVKLSAHRVALYFEALRDLPIEAVVKGLNQAAKVCTFFPKPAEVRTLAVGGDEDHAERAWMAFRHAMAQAGAYSSLAVQDPALAETIVAMFGTWPDACSAEFTPEMWASKRKEFGRVYRLYRDRELFGSRYLPGICEQQNARHESFKKYTPVAVLEGEQLRQLTGSEADAYRGQLAGEASGMRQLREAVSLPTIKGETA